MPRSRHRPPHAQFRRRSPRAGGESGRSGPGRVAAGRSSRVARITRTCSSPGCGFRRPPPAGYRLASSRFVPRFKLCHPATGGNQASGTIPSRRCRSPTTGSVPVGVGGGKFQPRSAASIGHRGASRGVSVRPPVPHVGGRASTRATRSRAPDWHRNSRRKSAGSRGAPSHTGHRNRGIRRRVMPAPPGARSACRGRHRPHRRRRRAVAAGVRTAGRSRDAPGRPGRGGGRSWPPGASHAGGRPGTAGRRRAIAAAAGRIDGPGA